MDDLLMFRLFGWVSWNLDQAILCDELETHEVKSFSFFFKTVKRYIRVSILFNYTTI